MLIKDKLIEKASKDTSQPLDLVDKVINWVTKDSRDAFMKGNSVELSGFGTLHVNNKNLKNRIAKTEEKIEKLLLAPKNKKTLNTLENAIQFLAVLKTKTCPE